MASHQTTILIVNKTADFLKFLVPVLGRFPKNQRFLLADRIQATVMDTLDIFVKAYYSPVSERLALLREANILLERNRQYFRVCYELGYYNSTKYHEISQQLEEIGNIAIRHPAVLWIVVPRPAAQNPVPYPFAQCKGTSVCLNF